MRLPHASATSLQQPAFNGLSGTTEDGVSSTTPGTVHTADCRRSTGKRQAVNPVGSSLMAPNRAQQQPSSNSTSTEDTSNYDNGFYTSCQIGNIKLDLLVDSGLSCTLLSFRKFNDINDNIRPKLAKANFSMKDVKGSNILIHGVATVNFKLGGGGISTKRYSLLHNTRWYSGSICYFMLKYVKHVDYERYIIQTRHD